MRFLVQWVLALVVAASAYADTTTFVHHSGKVPGVHARNMESRVGDSLFWIDWWGGECTFKVNLRSANVPPGQLNRLAKKDTVQFSAAWGGYRIHKRPDGVEWDMVLNAQPGDTAITFDINLTGLRAYYQPIFRVDSGNGLFYDTVFVGGDTVHVWQPDSVAGSYALYHATQKHNYSRNDTTYQYMTGKAGHIYRPRAWDSGGDTAWVTMVIDTVAGTFTLALPQAWLAGATYPVTIDPNFGNTTLQSLGGSWGSGAFKVTSNGVGQVNRIVMAMSNTANARVALLSHDASPDEPDVCLDTGWTFSNYNNWGGLTKDTAWAQVALMNGYTITDATTYWIGAVEGPDNIRYDNGTGQKWSAGNGCPWTESFDVDDPFSVYLEYNLTASTSGDSSGCYVNRENAFVTAEGAKYTQTSDDVWAYWWYDYPATTLTAQSFSDLIIPLDATIDSIIPIIEGYGTGTTAASRQVKIVVRKHKTWSGDTVTITLNQDTDTRQYVYGTTDKLWGLSWTPAEVMSGLTAIGVKDAGGHGDSLKIDQIMMRAYWTEAGGPPSTTIIGVKP